MPAGSRPVSQFRVDPRALAALRTALGIVAFAALVAIGARFSLPLPGSAVPLTLQVPFVLLAGAVLGARRGAASMGVYLAAGAMGLPAFALGAGPAYLVGPTGGYLIGFVPAAALAGFLSRRAGRTLPAQAAALLPGLLAIHACGALQLAAYAGGLQAAWGQGIAPFLLADAVKLAGAASAAVLWRSRRRPA